MLWLKACPRCQGDLLLQADTYGSYIACIQCGHTLQPEQEKRLALSLRELPRKRPVTATKVA